MTKADKNGLSERQLKAFPGLVSASSEEECCRLAKISRQTYYEWLKQPAFKAELSRLRGMVVTNAVESLKGYAVKAVGVLAELLDTSNQTLRRVVANDILNHVGKFIEIQELGKRVEALEDSADQRIKERS